jgi:nicotinate-nucleotide adenylyltransferase
LARRIAFFGGTFDPVHHGHLIVARVLAAVCEFERIVLVPAAVPPHKPPPLACGAHRLAMLQLATTQEDRLDVSDLELGRSGPSYTLDTLTALRRQHGPDVELHWIIGTDMLTELPSWHRVENVLEMARIVVASRPPWQETLEDVLTHLRGRLPEEHLKHLRAGQVETPLISISSSAIRSRLEANQSVRFMVPPVVDDYIAEHHIYQGA